MYRTDIVCDKCGSPITCDIPNRITGNTEVRESGGYTYGGMHLCATCNTFSNRHSLCKRSKDKF